MKRRQYSLDGLAVQAAINRVACGLIPHGAGSTPALAVEHPILATGPVPSAPVAAFFKAPSERDVVGRWFSMDK